MIAGSWWESTSVVPIPRSIIQDELEIAFPDIQFSVIAEKPDGITVYEIQWVAGPSNEEILEALDKRLGLFDKVIVQLKRSAAYELGGGGKPKQRNGEQK